MCNVGELPATVEDCESVHFNALLDVFLPARGSRLDDDFEVELECEGETFVLAYEDESATFSKGFAEDEPFISVRFDAAFYDFVRPYLQRVLAGEMSAGLTKNLRGISQADARGSFKALSSLEGLKAQVDVSGVGSFALARGPMDEAMDEMNFVLQRAELEAIFNADFQALMRLRPRKGMSLLPKLLSALAPVVNAFKRA